VIDSDQKCDLCLLQLERLPQGVEGLPLGQAKLPSRPARSLRW
jgi:hypothetical protein